MVVHLTMLTEVCCEYVLVRFVRMCYWCTHSTHQSKGEIWWRHWF